MPTYGQYWKLQVRVVTQPSNNIYEKNQKKMDELFKFEGQNVADLYYMYVYWNNVMI